MGQPEPNADFIVVGAGSSGCCRRPPLRGRPLQGRAARGGTSRFQPWVHLPIGCGKTMGQTPELGVFHRAGTEPPRSQDLLAARQRVLGGSSSINGLIAIRGQPEDYDAWERPGAHGWSRRDVLPYFRRIESNPEIRRRPVARRARAGQRQF